jgi:hypothetical protein
MFHSWAANKGLKLPRDLRTPENDQLHIFVHFIHLIQKEVQCKLDSAAVNSNINAKSRGKIVLLKFTGKLYG